MKEREILQKYKTIAVVGCSRTPEKPAHYVPKYLKEHGYKIIPVNPSAREILGERVYYSLLEILGDIDVVDVFRPAEEAPEIVKQAIKKGAKAVWLQEGIISEAAEKLAKKAGIEFVMDRCMMAEYRRHFG